MSYFFGLASSVSVGREPMCEGLLQVHLNVTGAVTCQATNAGAAKKDKTYAIKGTASGVDMKNPEQPQTVNKPFELSVTCP